LVFSLLNYKDDARSHKHKIYVYLFIFHPGIEFHVARMQANFRQRLTRDTTRSAGLH